MSTLPPTLVAWVNTQAKTIQDAGWPMNGPRERKIVATWRQERPKMTHALDQKGLLPKLALVLDRKRYEAKREYLKAGWPPTDAEEQAAKEWLMLGPENPEKPLLQLSDLTSISSIPRL